jgi:mannose-6-phosphate isomerase-like protein (cupin superfamily)
MFYRCLDQLPIEPISHEALSPDGLPLIEKRVLLRRGDLPGVMQVAQASFAPGAIAAAHCHKDMAEIFWVLSGQGTIEVDGVAYDLAAGRSVTIEPGELHEVRNTGDVPLVLLYLGLVL